MAPTAPHATPGASGRTLSGPERFWTSPWRTGIGVVCVVASLALHYELAPWSFLPEHEFEIRDTAGELAIPVDILQGDDRPPPPEPALAPPVPAEAPHPPTEKGERLDGGAPARDASPDAPRPPRRNDAGPRDKTTDGGPPREVGVGTHDDAAVAKAGQASGVARDAVGMIGAAGSAQAGPQNVVVTINMAVIRTHPVGRRIGPLFAAIPQWDDFLVGTGIEPLRDTDWVSINGPSIIHSEKDVILVHYSASDAVVDHALEAVGHKSGNGGPYDAGVPGMKAILGHADHADRVFMRPQPHVVAVVPPDYAATAARILSRAAIPRAPKRPTEAMRMTLIHPHGPMPAIPESVTEVRLWIVPRNSDGGADIYAEGDTAAPEVCAQAVELLRRVVREQNSFMVSALTHGLLDGLQLLPDGKIVRMHVPVSREQLEVILAFSAGKLGVDLGPQNDGGLPGAHP